MIIDLHARGSAGSLGSSAPVDDIIEEAKRIELDGICLTDQNCVWKGVAYQKGRSERI
jgi:histidinol phosphatase-like PHP family hydrolase